MTSPPLNIIIAVRIRGAPWLNPETQKALETLRLKRKYTASLYQKEPGVEGMLRKVKDWITWGEVAPNTLQNLMEQRGRFQRGGGIDQLKEKLNCESMEDLAERVCRGRISLKDLSEASFNLTFRLHPPKKGFKHSIKRPFKDFGELGYRGESINQLISRMI